MYFNNQKKKKKDTKSGLVLHDGALGHPPWTICNPSVVVAYLLASSQLLKSIFSPMFCCSELEILYL